jgi:uncharacterized MAPEG superfamily protein
MTTDLWYLALTAVLTASLWIPYVVSQVMTNGPLQRENYIDPEIRPMPLWGKRAHRVYLNAIEVFAPFAVLVIIAHVAGKVSSIEIFWIQFFFWVRLGHAVVYWAAFPWIRTILFTLGWIAVVAIFWQVMA